MTMIDEVLHFFELIGRNPFELIDSKELLLLGLVPKHFDPKSDLFVKRLDLVVEDELHIVGEKIEIESDNLLGHA